MSTANTGQKSRAPRPGGPQRAVSRDHTNNLASRSSPGEYTVFVFDVDNRAGGRSIASGGNQTTFWDAVSDNGEAPASAGSQLASTLTMELAAPCPTRATTASRSPAC